jgi:hypothetical protein
VRLTRAGGRRRAQVGGPVQGGRRQVRPATGRPAQGERCRGRASNRADGVGLGRQRGGRLGTGGAGPGTGQVKSGRANDWEAGAERGGAGPGW